MQDGLSLAKLLSGWTRLLVAQGLHGVDAGGAAGWTVGCGDGDGQKDHGGVSVDGSGEAVVAEVLEGEEVFEHRFGEVLLMHELVDRVGDGVSD